MSDKARKATDKQLAKMEKHIEDIYREAQDDISKKWDKFMKSHYTKLDKVSKDLREALESGDQELIDAARDKYNRAANNIVVNNRRFKSMQTETAARISHTNEIALNYVNDQMSGIYTVNYNAFGEEKIKGYSFSLVNEQAVKNLIKTGDLHLYKHVNVPKDIAWNEKFINSQVTQGILQGESIPQISDRIFPELMKKSSFTGAVTEAQIEGLIKRNINSSIRIARTMTTAAENKGRWDSYKKASDDGVELTREWVAAIDNRTRAWHAELDGQEVGINEPWVNEYGEIMYPGDPAADPCNVYNCRCSTKANVKGFKWNKEHKIVNGKDLSDVWERRPDQFRNEIEDIIAAQGFNGPPLIVKSNEFKKKVADSNFIAQRTYSAADKNALKEKQNDLYYGEWHVDRTVGKSVYGNGMYVFSTDGTSIPNSMIKAVEKYHEGKDHYIVETLTVDKSMKLADFFEIKQEMIDNGLAKADVGSYAALKGYDGVKVKRAGSAYGKDLDYTVILNRTKVIFKGD